MAHLIGVTGIPGSGKSYFARSAREVGPTAVALCDPKEAAFYGSDGYTAIEMFADLDWRPHADPPSFKATAFARLLRWLAAREADASQFVVVDPLSEVSDFAMHETLKMHATADPSDLPHGRAYTGHDQQFKALVTELRRLVARGKTVVCAFHGKMRELEGAGDPKRAKGMSGEPEWQFDEQMLPALNTSLRQTIHSPFNIWLYTKPSGFGPGRKHYVTAISDAVRPAKHSVAFKAGVNAGLLGNTMRELLDALV